MRLVFTPAAWEDYLWFQDHERKLLKRINLLIKDVLRAPFEGIGKPEPLKGDLTGSWSRRITDEHRLVYRVTRDEVTILACRFHYGK
jgi:toxin YoeB